MLGEEAWRGEHPRQISNSNFGRIPTTSRAKSVDEAVMHFESVDAKHEAGRLAAPYILRLEETVSSSRDQDWESRNVKCL